MNCLPWRLRIFIHDVFAHPFAGMLWIIGWDKAAYWIHNTTVPNGAGGNQDGGALSQSGPGVCGERGAEGD